MNRSRLTPASATHSNRRGFTLAELLIVVAILLVLTVMVVAVYNRDTGGNRMREAARSVQSSFMGAKDRALHAKERAGLRFLRDPNNTNLATGFVYIQPLEKLTFGGGTPGTFGVCRPAGGNYTPPGFATVDEPRILIFDSGDGTTIRTLDTEGLIGPMARFQIPAGSGPWYRPKMIVPNPTSPPFYTTTSGTLTVLEVTANVVATTNPFNAIRSIDFNDSNATCTLDLGYEITPYHQPLALPSGVVIDLVNSSANLTAGLTSTDLIDIIYNPSGTVFGPRAAKGPIHLLLRDIRDATVGNNPLWVGTDSTVGNLAETQPKYDMLVVTIMPQTGHVQSYPVNLVDAKVNATGAAGADNLADDLFWYAKTGNRAGN